MRILLVSGSTRGGSTNTAALATLAALAPAPVTPVRYDGLTRLPAFNPDHDGDLLPAVVAELRREIGGAAAVLFCTPEYAGNLPGSFKNLLDWTVGGGELLGKPAAWVNVAAPGRGTGATAALDAVLAYVGADVVREACRDAPVGRSTIGPDGTVADPRFTVTAGEVWRALLGRLAPRS
jgi:NAD(P)H-dependent FMN reductase